MSWIVNQQDADDMGRGHKSDGTLRKRYARWTPEKEVWLKNHYKYFSTRELAAKTHMCRMTIVKKMKELGLEKTITNKVKKVQVSIGISEEAFKFLCRYSNRSLFIDNILCQLARRLDEKEDEETTFNE